MNKKDLIVPFTLRQSKNFPGPRTVEQTLALVKILGLHRMTVAEIRERIKWFEGEHSSLGIVDGWLVRAILKDKQNQEQQARNNVAFHELAAEGAKMMKHTLVC